MNESVNLKAARDVGKPKDSKKDRHMRNLYEFSQFLEKVNEDTVQSVLMLSRVCRETLETVDIDLENYCNSIQEYDYLISKNEDEVDEMLNELKRRINARYELVDKLGIDLDHTELKRVDRVGVELKSLVDRLVAISFQLPDDIERLVSNEAFEVNQEVIANRVVHTKTVGEMKITHFKLEAALIVRWEESKKKWRKIRHEKAVNEFRSDIRSPYYNEPDDRKNYMKKFRKGQQARKEEVNKNVKALIAQQYHNISSAAIAEIKTAFEGCSEVEAQAIQECYNGLTQLRNNTDYLAKERVESVRKELHLFGALKIDPKLHLLANQLEPALEDENLAELWRLGGGLKPDIQSLCAELRCEEIVYDRVITSMKDKLTFILASFPLKAVLEERGRLAQLDKTRTLVGKMRSAPRNEMANVLRSLVPELEDIATMENLNELFTGTLKGVAEEIQMELASYESKMKMLNASVKSVNTLTSGTTNPSITPSTLKTQPLESTAKSMKTMTLGKSKKSDPKENAVYIDPLLLKNWQRKLAILFYGTDISENYQKLCTTILENVELQRECNVLVDELVKQESEDLLRRMDNRYKKLVESIITYLENQAMLISTQTTNLCNFYTQLAKVIEKHKVDQKKIDDRNTEELWDVKEDYRIQHEDLEAEYEKLCQKIRESTNSEEIGRLFEEIIQVLEKIQICYREYHKHACFSADKYPLWCIDEYRTCLNQISQLLFMQPHPDHHVLSEYERVFDMVERFNSSFFENNPLAAGVERSANEKLHSTTAGDFSVPYGQGENAAAFTGNFAMHESLLEVYKKYSVENFFKEQDKPEENKIEETPEAENDALKALANKMTPHPDCPWLKVTSTIVPVDQESLDNMDKEDRIEYEEALAKYFMPLVDDIPPPVDPATLPPKKGAPPKDTTPQAPAVSIINPGVFPTLSQLSLEDRAKYNELKAYVEQIQARLAIETSPEYVRNHLPSDSQGTAYICQIEVTREEIDVLFQGVRKNLLINLEVESFKKMAKADRDMSQVKTEMTDQLEERIRNHWPRRGRVETEIKQPREKELLQHKDKTYRLILQIQNKVVEIEKKYSELVEQSKNACGEYVEEMEKLKEALLGEFKNLAALQGLDVKARGLTLDFQADSSKRIDSLNKMQSHDLDSVMAFARDFRKICPLQKPGVEGGYSEAELEEIGGLMERQCADVITVRQQWALEIDQLNALQQQSLIKQEEFVTQYNKSVQQVAMAEGLGQKYGAPRRRAQERLRSEVTRDERAAGRVDEFLALLDFVCQEMSASHPMDSKVHQGVDHLNRVQYVWGLGLALRTTLMKRVVYLQVVGEKDFPTQLKDLPWVEGEKLRERVVTSCPGEESSLLLSPTLPPLEDPSLPGQAAPLGSLEEVYEEVNKVCKEETKKLYESEGMGGSGLPSSLLDWLAEAKDKLLGRGGYRERAWKRVWGQVLRLDHLFGRMREGAAREGEGEGGGEAGGAPSALSLSSSKEKLSVQEVALSSLVEGALSLSQDLWREQERHFASLLQGWEKERGANERLLSPKLGSPDRREELEALDRREKERSEEMVKKVLQLRGQLVRGGVERFKSLLVDLGGMARGLILLLDSTPRQEVLSVPPDTQIPKKHLTLKKLRKAQRRKEETGTGGGEDVSLFRTWGGIVLSEEEVKIVTAAEDMVLDLGSLPEDVGGGPLELVGVGGAGAAGGGKDSKGKGGEKKKPDKNAPPVVQAPPSLLPKAWRDQLGEGSAIGGRVSPAHRGVVGGREEGVKRYLSFLQDYLERVREEYEGVLKGEESWRERWDRQVQILREGKL